MELFVREYDLHLVSFFFELCENHQITFAVQSEAEGIV